MRHFLLLSWAGCFALTLACNDPADLTLGAGGVDGGARAGSGGGGTGGVAGTAGSGAAGSGSAGLGGNGGSGGLSGSGGGGVDAGTMAPAYSSGLPGDTLLNALASEQLSSLCSTLTAYDTSWLYGDAACRYAGDTAALLANNTTQSASDELLQQVCQTAYQSCAQPKAAPGCSAFSSSCTATVSELESCHSDTASAVGDLTPEAGTGYPACATLSVASMATIAGLLPLRTPDSCAQLATSCPEALPKE